MVKCRKLNTKISMIIKGANMTTPANTPYRTGWRSLQALSLAFSLLHMRRTIPGPADPETRPGTTGQPSPSGPQIEAHDTLRPNIGTFGPLHGLWSRHMLGTGRGGSPWLGGATRKVALGRSGLGPLCESGDAQ